MKALSTVRALSGVRRAWPGHDGSITFELAAPAGKLRAGSVSPAGEVWITGYASDSKLPELTPDFVGGLVVHRLHRRAVMLTGDRAVKFTRKGRANAVAVQSSQVAELCDGSGITAARVLTHSPSRVELTLLPGRTLHDLGGDGLPGWRRFAEAWPGLVARPSGLPEHTGLDEANVLWRWFKRAREHRALSLLGRLGTETTQLCQLLATGDDGTRVLTHRDLHDKQLLWDGTTLGLLDLDTAVRGEAALDLGNLQAHVELRHAQGSITSQERDRILALLLDDLAGALPVTPDRIATYHRAARLRLAFVYAFRPKAASWLPNWVEETLAVSGPTPS